MSGNPYDAEGGDRLTDRLRARIGQQLAQGQRDGERLRARIYRLCHARGRLWLGLPVVAVVAFLLFFPLRTVDLPLGRALAWGGMAAGVAALCWALGVWATTDERLAGEERDESDEDTVSRWIKTQRQRSPVMRALFRLLGSVLLLVAFAAFCYPQLELLFAGEGQTVRALAGVLLKVVAAAMVCLPIKLTAPRG